MSRYTKLLVLIFLLPLCAMSQGDYDDFKWKKPKASKQIPTKWAAEDAVCTRYYRSIVNYIIDLRTWRTKTSETVIQRIKIQTPRGLEQYSKIYLWKRDMDVIEVLDARVIKPNGKVIDMKASDLKKLEFASEDYQYERDQLRFAIPGVEVGDEIEYIYRFKRNGLQYSGDLYMHTNFPTLESEVKLKVPVELQLDVLGYNGIPDYILEEGTETLTLKWKMTDLESIGNDAYSMPWKQLPYASFVIRSLFAGSGKTLKKHSLVDNSWVELYRAYDDTYSDVLIQRSGQGSFKNYFEEHVAASATQDSFKQLQFLYNSYLDDLNLIWLSEEESNNALGHFIQTGNIDHRNFHRLMRRTFRKLGLEYFVCYARSKYYGAIDTGILAPGFICDVFFAVEERPGRYRFIYPGEKGKEYRIDELPFYLYGSEVYLVKGKSFEANNVEVKKIELKDSNAIQSRKIRNNELTLSEGLLSNWKVEERFTGIVASENRPNILRMLEDPDAEKKELKVIEDQSHNMTVSYSLDDEIELNEVAPRTFSVSIQDILSHNLRYLGDNRIRILDYYPRYALHDEVTVKLNFDKEVEIINLESLTTNIEEGQGGYRLSIEMDTDKMSCNVTSIYVDMADPVPAADYGNRSKSATEIEETMKADLIFKYID